jgi:hypothetical protein
LSLIEKESGIIKGNKIKIKIQEPVAPLLEVSFPNVVFDKQISVFQKDSWKFKGKWQTVTRKSYNGSKPADVSQYSDRKADVAEFTFTGTGVSLTGSWNREGGKADIFLDDKYERTIDTYFFFNDQQWGNISIWQKFNLPHDTHKIRIEVRGEKRTESEGAKINLTDALVFVTAPKKNENFKFTFE